MYELNGSVYIYDKHYDEVVEKQEGRIVTIKNEQYKIVEGYNDKIRVVKL